MSSATSGAPSDFPGLGGAHGAIAERLHATANGADAHAGFEVESPAFTAPLV